MGVKYSICSTHYNMVETIEKSLKSILDQIDERFEVVVVDEGSTDGSLEILKRLEKEEENLRVIVKEKNGRNLGKTRNISIKEAKGKYVLLQLDMDDLYEEGILDFIEVFHQLDEQLDFDFYLFGKGINMVRKDFFMGEIGGYRDLPVGAEDLDLWRRLIARNVMIPLEHKKFSREIGSGKSAWEKFCRILRVRRSELKSGLKFSSYFKWFLTTSAISNPLLIPGHIVILLIAYMQFVLSGEERMDLPEEMKGKGNLEREIDKIKLTLPEIEEKYGISIEREEFSDRGMDIFHLT